MVKYITIIKSKVYDLVKYTILPMYTIMDVSIRSWLKVYDHMTKYYHTMVVYFQQNDRIVWKFVNRLLHRSYTFNLKIVFFKRDPKIIFSWWWNFGYFRNFYPSAPKYEKIIFYIWVHSVFENDSFDADVEDFRKQFTQIMIS